ncbi:hypothetical protein Tco_0729298 [Tanacetum coccineum]|uniref:Uncharacterized protein n=1 Tax=Tanacetum coccineum TaxID=301880 RepID=A0ABQ4YR83_9ASTR
MRCAINFLSLRQNRSRILEVFECILQVKIKLLIKKLEDSEDEHQVYGRIVRIKILHDDLGVNTARLELLLLSITYCFSAAGIKVHVAGYNY